MDKSVQRLVNVDSFNHDEFSTNFPCKNSTQLFLRRLASRSDKISFPSCYRQEMPITKCSLKESSIHLFQKTLSERTANGSCRADCTTERYCGFHIWCTKTSSSRGTKLILPYERPTGSGLTSPFTRNLAL